MGGAMRSATVDPAVLLGVRDLPEGYAAGHSHTTAPTGREPTRPGCRPLARLLRETPPMTHEGHGGHEGHSGGHEGHGGHKGNDGTDVLLGFSKSHFGPTITQRVLSLNPDAAARRVAQVEGVAGRCPTYVQSTSRIGAGTYAVHPLAQRAGAPEGTYLRLDAVGRDFRGIRWDVWVAVPGGGGDAGVLQVLTFRSAKGGGDADFWDAVRTAASRAG